MMHACAGDPAASYLRGKDSSISGRACRADLQQMPVSVHNTAIEGAPSLDHKSPLSLQPYTARGAPVVHEYSTGAICFDAIPAQATARACINGGAPALEVTKVTATTSMENDHRWQQPRAQRVTTNVSVAGMVHTTSAGVAGAVCQLQA
eukprot:1160277-Pelagomonas_calceolata.AAC.13